MIEEKTNTSARNAGETCGATPKCAATNAALDEPILPDDYLIYADYFYVADGRVVRSDWHGITARQFKGHLRATELRRCDIFGRQEMAAIAKGDRPMTLPHSSADGVSAARPEAGGSAAESFTARTRRLLTAQPHQAEFTISRAGLETLVADSERYGELNARLSEAVRVAQELRDGGFNIHESLAIRATADRVWAMVGALLGPAREPAK